MSRLARSLFCSTVIVETQRETRSDIVSEEFAKAVLRPTLCSRAVTKPSGCRYLRQTAGRRQTRTVKISRRPSNIETINTHFPGIGIHP